MDAQASIDSGGDEPPTYIPDHEAIASWVDENLDGDGPYIEGIRQAARVAAKAEPHVQQVVLRNTVREALGYAKRAGVGIGAIARLFCGIAEMNGLVQEIGPDGVTTLIDVELQDHLAKSLAGSPANGHEPPPHDRIPESADTVTDFGIPRSSTNAPRFTLEMLDEIAITDDPVELIRGLLPMGPTFGIVYGPPKSLKSFLLNHIGLHIADSRPFCGRDVQGGAVVLVTSEGIRGVRRRLIGERRSLGIEGKGVPFALVPTMPNLGAGEGDRVALQASIAAALKNIGQPLRLIVIDTFRRAMPGKSESEQKDVSIVVDNCEALSRAFGCLVLAVHHCPRSDDTRGSGSNAIDAAADLMWGVVRDEVTGRATATVARYKDGEEGDTWTFELRPVELAIDRDGNPITSCAVEITTEPVRKTAAAKNRAPLSTQQQRVFDIVRLATAEAGQPGLAGEAAPRSIRAITRATLKVYAKTAGWWDDSTEKADESSRAKLNARLNELATKRAIGLTAEHVWPVERAP
jgi:hypothetical protein